MIETNALQLPLSQATTWPGNVTKKLIKVFFSDLSHPSSCFLLPSQRDSTITSRLRSATIYILDQLP